MTCKSNTSVLLICLILSTCNCTFGNPARSIRGTFVDPNQPQFQRDEILSDQESQEPVSISLIQDSLEVTMVDIESYNQALSSVMAIVAMDANNARSTMDMCKMSRSRLTALQIMNSLQALQVKFATAQTDDTSIATASLLADIKEEIPKLAKALELMQFDLREFDEGRFGSFAMAHFTRGLKNFSALEKAVAAAK